MDLPQVGVRTAPDFRNRSVLAGRYPWAVGARRIGASTKLLRGCATLALAPALAAALPQSAKAQSTVATPSRDELEAKTAPPAPPARNVRIDGEIERSPCALANPAYAAITVKLSAVAFNNLGPVDPSALTSSYADLLGKDLPISAVCEIRDRAATKLRQLGYLAAVQVPTQRIENGQVRFEVLYAKLTAIRVRGEPGRSARLFESYLNHLVDGQPFNRRNAERYLLLARDVPGFDVRLELKPAGTNAGDMIGDVTLRPSPIAVDATIQNYGAIETGRFSGQLRAEIYGLTGLGDRTTLSAYTTADFQEQQVLAVGHDFLLGGQGFGITSRLTYAWTRPSLGAGVPPVRAETLFASIGARYPLVRALGGSAVVGAGIDLVDENIRFNGAPLSRDRLRIAFARIEGEMADMRGIGPGGTTGWRIGGALEVRRGLNILGTTPNCVATPLLCTAAGAVPPSLVDSDPTATVVRASGSGEYRIARNATIYVAARGQWTASALPAFEQFSLGNYTIGRGYDPGTLAGDSGIGLTGELRATGVKPFRKVPVTVDPYGFVDTAWVWNRYSPAGRDPQRLTSIGAGVRVNWEDRTRLDATLAVPVSDAGSIRSGDLRFLVSLTTRIAPWRSR